ncbi:MAG: ABC transporter permease [Bifidobacteriaceae bacterium]|nr:ABC transporter permease [Bifidobacteriaceae bacterium]
MIALTMTLGACVATAMLGVMFDVGDKVNAELKAYGANIVVQPKGAAVLTDLYDDAAALASTASLRESDLANIPTIFWAHNIVDFAPFLEHRVTLLTDDAGPSPPQATIVGTWFAHELMGAAGQHTTAGLISMRSWWQVDGGWIADQDEGLALVGANLADAAGIAIGDTLTVDGGQGRSRDLRVAGIIHSSGPESDQLVAPLSTVQALAGRAGEVGRVEVAALTTPDNDLARRAARNPESLSVSEMETWYCTAYASSIAYQLDEVLTDAVAKPVRQVTESEGSILAKTQLLMLLVTALSLAASALAIANLMTASVMERAPEIGLLKAVGARDGSVVGLILAEMGVTGLAGGALGYGLGLGFAQVIGHAVFGESIAVRPIVAASVVVLVGVVIVAGAIPSIRMLARLRPADVLHGR